jgi:hypothetical protein
MKYPFLNTMKFAEIKRLNSNKWLETNVSDLKTKIAINPKTKSERNSCTVFNSETENFPHSPFRPIRRELI